MKRKSLVIMACSLVLAVSMFATGCARAGQVVSTPPEPPMEEQASSVGASSVEDEVSSEVVSREENTSSKEPVSSVVSLAPQVSSVPQGGQTVSKPNNPQENQKPQGNQTPSSSTSQGGQTSSSTVSRPDPKWPQDPLKYIYEYAPEFPQKFIELVNVEREKNGLPPLKEVVALSDYAKVRCKEIVTKCDHVRPDGSDPLPYVLTLGGYRAAGENIMSGYNFLTPPIENWMNSPEDRANILSPDFAYIGVGAYYWESPYDKNYYVMIFAG